MNRWELSDWSIVDIYWNIITSEERDKIKKSVQELPVSKFKDDIAHIVWNFPITIIQWETGSWKTTQIPKMLEKFWRVVVTQPRVISAISLADRISRELMAQTWDANYSLGLKVWYRTGQQVSSAHTSKISLHSDWLELMRQWVSKAYSDVLILDEIHGYSIPTEMIARNVRLHMLNTKTDMRLVLMSATVNPSVLQEYFSAISKDIPVIKIPGRTHKVEKHFLIHDDYVTPTCKLYKEGKNILLFAEWKKEIEVAIHLLRNQLWEDALIYPLHSELPIQDQIKLLKKETDAPIIIVTTNIAEESLTFDYIDAVVDMAKEKTIFVNDYGIDRLETIDTAQSNCMQRAGRSGRTHDGIYTRTNSMDYELLRDFPIAPIEKEMLDRYILISLLDGIDLRKGFWEHFIHKPSIDLLNLSFTRLTSLWAINKNGKITALWISLLKFPLSIYNSMILLESISKWCSESIIPMVAILEKKWFLSKSWAWKEIKMKGKNDGDLFAYLDLYNMITSNNISKGKLDLLIELWVDEDEINLFKELEWKKMLFEVVKLDTIGIKTKKVLEIYNMVKILKEKFEALSYKIWKNTDVAEITSALAAGHLHNIYIYNEETGRLTNFDNKIPIDFKPGDISLVELVSGWLYIGSPFIISWETDLNLITNLVKVDDGIIKEYSEMMVDEDLREIFGHSNPNHKDIKITEDNIQHFNIDEVNFDLPVELTMMKDKTKARHYLAKNWLPYFLVNHNKNFIHFIKRWKFDKAIFAELLKKITPCEMHRINPDNLAKTIHVFQNDMDLFQQFIDTDDKIVKAFLSGKIKTLQDFATFEMK